MVNSIRCWVLGAAFRLLVAGGLAISVAPVWATQVSISPSANTVSVGDVFAIRFRIEGLSGAAGASLSAFDITLAFDESAVQWTGFSFDDAGGAGNQLDLAEPGSFGFLGDALNTGLSSINAFGLSGNSAAVLDAWQANDFDFLTLSFKAVADTSAAVFSVNSNNPGLLFVDSGASNLAVAFGALSASVSIGGATGVVAEPSSLWLVTLALLALPRWLGRGRRGLWVLAASMSLAAGASAAEPPQTPTTTAARAVVSGTVTQVQGQRLLVKSDKGNQAWFTTATPLTAQHVGRRVRGESRPVGDTQLIDKPTFE